MKKITFILITSTLLFINCIKENETLDNYDEIISSEEGIEQETEDEENEQDEEDEESKLIIEEIHPLNAGIDDEVTIKFSGVIDKNINKHSVTFNDIESNITEISYNQLTCIVPKYATSGNITLIINEQVTTSTENFTVDYKDYPRRYFVYGGDFSPTYSFCLRSLFYSPSENTFKYETHWTASSWWFEDIDILTYNEEYNQFIGFDAYYSEGSIFKIGGEYSQKFSGYSGKDYLTVFVDTNQNKTFTITAEGYYYSGYQYYLVEINNGIGFQKNEIVGFNYVNDEENVSINPNLFIKPINSIVYLSKKTTYPKDIYINKVNTSTLEVSKEIIKNNSNIELSHWRKLILDDKNNRIIIIGLDSDNFFELSLVDNSLSKINTSGLFLDDLSNTNVTLMEDKNQIIFGRNHSVMDLTNYKIERMNTDIQYSSLNETSPYIIID